jgi:hypothetical protein
MDKFRKNFENMDDLSSDAYKDLIAGSSEDEEGSHNEEEIERQRNLLLSGLTSTDNKKKYGGGELESDNSQDLDVKFNVGFAENIGQKLVDEKQETERK